MRDPIPDESCVCSRCGDWFPTVELFDSHVETVNENGVCTYTPGSVRKGDSVPASIQRPRTKPPLVPNARRLVPRGGR